MKTIYIFLLSILFLTGCSEDYKLDESFTLPTELSGPEEVAIDLQSSENIVLTWNGGANDGGFYYILCCLIKEMGTSLNPYILLKVILVLPASLH